MSVKSRCHIAKCVLFGTALTLWLLGSVQAEEKRCVAVHVPQDDPKAMKQVVHIASNLPKQLGVDNVTVELVARDPGLALLTEDSPEVKRIQSLIAPSENTMGGGTTLSDCAATIAGIKKKTGKEPVLLQGVRVVHPGAVVSIDGASGAGLFVHSYLSRRPFATPAKNPSPCARFA